MKDWRKNALARLKGRDAPRVLTKAMLIRISAAEKSNITPASVLSFVREAESLDVLRKVRSGLYINRSAVPPAIPEEAAQHIRRGAVVSLHSVLGDAGVLNNPTAVIYCVVPILDNQSSPNVGQIEAEGRTFSFHGVPERIMFAGSFSDRLDQSVPYPRATPEAALCHWLHLAKARRSVLRPPSHESDVSGLNLDRLMRLSKAAGMDGEVSQWISAAKSYAEDVPDHESALGL